MILYRGGEDTPLPHFIIERSEVSLIDNEVHETRKSEYYDMLAWMGLLGTEEAQINAVRSQDAELYEDLEFSYGDIERIGYLYPHFYCNPKYMTTDSKGNDLPLTELWVEDHYINPNTITWVKTTNVLYGVLDRDFEDQIKAGIKIKCYYNPSILFRYTNIGEPDTLYSHTEILDISSPEYNGLNNIADAIYFISQNKFYKPKVEKVDDSHIKIIADYTEDIDLFVCSNLVNVVEVKANEGAPVIQVDSNRCYHRMFVDHDPSYPIDCRFYPYVKVDKSAVIRVFKDSYHLILRPEVSRLTKYKEFLGIEDPYNTSNEYFENLDHVTDIIGVNDTDEVLLDKFSRIAAYCYRLWENYPWNANEQSDFVICDNSNFVHKAFVKRTIRINKNEYIEKLCSTVPFESYRDLVFYKGYLFSDYDVMTIGKTRNNTWVKAINGDPVYIIDTEYDPNELTIVKFNTFEDSTYVNIDQYFNSEFINRLHFKMNRFYRNLLVIRNEYIKSDKVRISSVQPTQKDHYLWYELLVNAVPEMFEKKMIDIINLYGLDPDNIPEDVLEGAYMLELDPEGGPESYTKMLMTYFNLSKAKKDYLALQYDNPEDDPRFKKLDHVNVGKEEEFETEEEMNYLLIEDPIITSSTGETEYEYGRPNDPGRGDHHTPGNLYGQLDLLPPPPGKENIDIDKIETGPQEPFIDKEHTLWIDTGDEPFDQVWQPDELDGVTSHMTYTSDVSTIDAKVSDYAIEDPDFEEPNDQVSISELLDGVRDGLSPIPSGNADIDGLLDDLVGPDEVPLAPVDFIDQLGDAVANNIQVSNIENPTYGMIALDDIGYMHADTFDPMTIEEIEEMSSEDKLNTLRKLITDDNEPEDARLGDLWIKYLSTQSEEVVNTIVYKVLLTVRAQQLTHISLGDLALEGLELPEDWATIAYGEYPEWTKPKQMIITPFGEDDEGNVQPDYDIVKKNLFNYFYHYMPDMKEKDYGPDDPEIGDLWLNVDAAYLGQLIKDLISDTIVEFGLEVPPGIYREEDHDIYATMGFDYGVNSDDSHLGEEFHKVVDEKLYDIHYGEVEPISMDEGDLWYEFLDTIDNRVAYSDKDSMVIRVDERLLLLKFDHNNIQTYAFDDIVMNFKGSLGIRYMTLVADLINSGEISKDDINIFWQRLITYGDDFDPQMHRLYTGKSYVISLPKIDTSDYSIIYSTNIGRFRINYADGSTTRKEREAAYRMCIDYTTREEFAYLSNRMLVFVNGKYIHRSQIREVAAYMIYIDGFDEVISNVDIFYMKKDQLLMDMKRAAYKYWPEKDTSEYIQLPDINYTRMEKISVDNYTYKGYYDVLINELILSGKLEAMLAYLEEHPDQADEYRRDLVHKFHAISDTDLSNMKHHDSRIVIPAFSDSKDTPYQIGYQEPQPDYHIWNGGN